MRKLKTVVVLAVLGATACGCAVSSAEKARIRGTLIQNAAQHQAEDHGTDPASRVTWVYLAR